MSLVLVLVSLISYFSTWVVNIGGGLTLHAFDLAEWASLHPVVRAESPALLTTLLLRLPLLFMGMMLALTARRAEKSLRPLHWMAAYAIVLGLLPPLDFIKQLGNSNYQQQAVMALCLLIVVVGCVIGIGRRAYRPLAATSAVIALAAGVLGGGRAIGLMRDLGLTAQIGVGFIVMPICLSGFVALQFWAARQPRSEEQGSPKSRTTLSQ